MNYLKNLTGGFLGMRLNRTQQAISHKSNAEDIGMWLAQPQR